MTKGSNISTSTKWEPYYFPGVDDTFSWRQAIPLPDIYAETIAETFVTTEIAHFGFSSTVTTDRGPQFESRFFAALKNPIGTRHVDTPPTTQQPMVW